MARHPRTLAFGSQLLAWLVVFAILAGFAPFLQQTSSSAVVATVLLRASEPEDIAPTAPNEPVLERHARLGEGDARSIGRSPLVRAMRVVPAALGILPARLLRAGARDAHHRIDRARAIPIVHPSTRVHLRLMVFLD